MSLKKKTRQHSESSEDSHNLYQPTNFPSSENRRETNFTRSSSTYESSSLLPLQFRPEDTRMRAAKNNPRINYALDDLKKSVEEEYEAIEEAPA
jgi:hypothetical protein